MMIGSSSDSTRAICSICYEHLKPSVEDLQAISICGHVFHELCIQQWFGYCSEGNEKCPTCKQTCLTANVRKLYFQTLGESTDANSIQIHKSMEALSLTCGGLKEQLKIEQSLKNEAIEEISKLKGLLCSETLKLQKSEVKQLKLRLRNMALGEKLGALKLWKYKHLVRLTSKVERKEAWSREELEEAREELEASDNDLLRSFPE